MSADKDRGIRRQKQKRAKQAKKQGCAPAPARAERKAVAQPADKKAA
jgi:hypothetical protein